MLRANFHTHTTFCDGKNTPAEMAEAAYRLPYHLAKSAAYTENGRYYLLYGYPAVPKALRRTLSEFAEKTGGTLRCAQIREQAKPLCTQNAVAVIGEQLV